MFAAIVVSSFSPVAWPTPTKNPASNKVTPSDVARTVYHAMGMDDLSWTDREGRPIDLLPEGNVIDELF